MATVCPTWPPGGRWVDGDPGWELRELGGPEGIKFDRIELLDLDRDGDLDLMTCEERHAGRGLGVVWYENPLR